jgi:hypothetical protein
MDSRKSQAILMLDDDCQVILLGRKISDNKSDKEKLVTLFRSPFSSV